VVPGFLVFVFSIGIVSAQTIDSLITPALDLQRAALDYDVVTRRRLGRPTAKREATQSHHTDGRDGDY